MKFSIIVVCLNAGKELDATVKSILDQKYTDYEVIVKDGGTTDGSIQRLPGDKRIRLIRRSDLGIYDAMNQALEEARGDYAYFLNCGDYLADENVLGRVAVAIDGSVTESSTGPKMEDRAPAIFYGDIFERISSTRVASNPDIDEFACYRNLPCHQACFYDRKMIMMHPFNTEYKVRADYEQFLWCYFIAKCRTRYIDELIASYMGGGFSETRLNRKKSNEEHKEIVENYMPHSHVVRYKWRLILTLAPVRRWLASKPATAAFYNKVKSCLYKKKS